MGVLRRPLLALVLVALAAGAGRAQTLRLDRVGGEGPVEIRADEIEARLLGQEPEVTARGAVSVVWDGYRLRADRVRFDPSADRVEAEGRVVFTDPGGNRLECDRFEVNLGTQRGVIRRGRLWIAAEGYEVWGERFERVGERSYLVEQGGFTACDGTWPSWRVEADRVDVELEGFVRARGAAFWMEGAPLAYTPVLVFPVIRERRTGFLLPRLGWSDSQGLRWLQRFYWAPADAWDATLRAEYRSRRGWTEGVEVRYAPAEGHAGRVDLEHLFDRTDRSHRYALEADHESRFGEGQRLRVLGRYQGDTRYREELADDLDERDARRLRSFGLWSWDRAGGTAYGLAEFFQALDTSQAGVLQTLPRVGFLGRPVRVAGPLVADLEADGARFWRAQGERGERFTLFPRVGVDGRFGALAGTARVGFRENGYRLDGDDRFRGAPVAEAAVGAFGWRRWGGWLHTVEPFAGIRVEGRGHGDDPPVFDTADRFDEGALARAGLGTRWLRGGEERVGADLAAERDLDRGRAGTLRADAFWLLGGRWWVEGAYDLGSETWESWGAGWRTRGDDRRFARAEVRHRRDETTYLDLGLGVGLGRYGRAAYRNRADLLAGRLLEDAILLGVRHPCWELDLTYSRTLLAEEDRLDRKVFLTVNLKGLGTLGTWKGFVP